MKILHTADLHLGQVIYQNYDRVDEHAHYFNQLEEWCRQERPDALLVSGDVFDIQQPSAATQRMFTERFVRLHEAAPEMAIIVTAGNHDSPSRLAASEAVWRVAGAHLIGLAPPSDPSLEPDWERRYIVRLPVGYIIALPFMTAERRATAEALVDCVARENTTGLPVVMMAHAAVTGCDWTGHNVDIGNVRTQTAATFGAGYDYLALGHIHRPQTLLGTAHPLVRYAGSALHVSHDEQYPHTVSLVEIPRLGGEVSLRELRINELRHFYTLPREGAYTSADEALDGLRAFIQGGGEGYFRFRLRHDVDLPSDFNQTVYDTIAPYDLRLRFNPKPQWEGDAARKATDEAPLEFEVSELQEMSDPLAFVLKTHDQYPALTPEELTAAFEQVRDEVHRAGEQ